MYRLASDVHRGYRLQEPVTDTSIAGWRCDPHAREVVRFRENLPWKQAACGTQGRHGPGRQATCVNMCG